MSSSWHQYLHVVNTELCWLWMGFMIFFFGGGSAKPTSKHITSRTALLSFKIWFFDYFKCGCTVKIKTRRKEPHPGAILYLLSSKSLLYGNNFTLSWQWTNFSPMNREESLSVDVRMRTPLSPFYLQLFIRKPPWCFCREAPKTFCRRHAGDRIMI